MKKVISIVEDEKDLNELVKRYLEKEGYDVRAYLTYDEAQLHTGDNDVALWILDIMLGDKSGFDLIEEIRQLYPTLPVIFMSARDKEFDRIIGLEKAEMIILRSHFLLKSLCCVLIMSFGVPIKMQNRICWQMDMILMKASGLLLQKAVWMLS